MKNKYNIHATSLSKFTHLEVVNLTFVLILNLEARKRGITRMVWETVRGKLLLQRLMPASVRISPFISMDRPIKQDVYV